MHDIHDRPDGSKSNIKRRIECPNIPPEEWCDYRRDYESGLSLECIAEKYCCDHRTARNAIIKNKSSCDIGKKTTPRKISEYTKEIDRLIILYCKDHKLSMLRLSTQITAELKKSGYPGSERTVRNHLNTLPQVKALLEKDENIPDKFVP